MYPTIHENDLIFVDKRHNVEYNRGDIVVMASPIFEDEKYVKRIIGIGGDLIEITNGKVYVNGVQEMYIKGCSTYSYNFEYWDIPEGYVYVLGDNREDSLDSRYFGCVPVEALDGKVRYKYYADKKKLGKVY